ncbi:unnamed protein product [Phytophthora lilii]|uniref:Unnamed protein product n=1 Tax=Phytophthora lilii TaxID=2077276 RepID=A0A9W6WI67_9STRA|nr:unnamed protein product [Phytophthora lilii]
MPVCHWCEGEVVVRVSSWEGYADGGDADNAVADYSNDRTASTSNIHYRAANNGDADYGTANDKDTENTNAFYATSDHSTADHSTSNDGDTDYTSSNQSAADRPLLRQRPNKVAGTM